MRRSVAGFQGFEVRSFKVKDRFITAFAEANFPYLQDSNFGG